MCTTASGGGRHTACGGRAGGRDRPHLALLRGTLATPRTCRAVTATGIDSACDLQGVLRFAGAARRRTRAWRQMVLPGLACLIGVYVLLHSPAQGTIAVLLRSPSHGCYFRVASYPW